MKPKGWRSEQTLNAAKKELLEAGFIAETRKGRRPNLCSLYGKDGTGEFWRQRDQDAAGRPYRHVGLWRARHPLEFEGAGLSGGRLRGSLYVDRIAALLLYYYAINKDTDDRFVEKLQSALEQVRSSGRFNAIVDHYR